jgi:hypothetical protein
MEPVDAALAAVDALELGEKLVYVQIVRRYNFTPRTIAQSVAARKYQALHHTRY